MYRKVAIIAVALAMTAASAPAAFILSLDDGVGNTASVTDGADPDGLNGLVMFNGSLGAGQWIVNVTTGIGSSVLGLPGLPKIDLNSVNVSSAGAGTLNILLVESDLTTDFNPLNFAFNVGGTTNGLIDAFFCIDATNGTGSGCTSSISFSDFSGGAFSGSGSSFLADLDDPFSIKVGITIDHSQIRGVGNSSFDAEGSTTPDVPEPATVLLFSTALLGLGFLRRKKIGEGK